MVSCLIMVILAGQQFDSPMWLDGFIRSSSGTELLVDFSADAAVHELKGYYGGRLVPKDACYKLPEAK